MNITIAEKKSSDGNRRVIVYKERTKGTQFPFTIQAFVAGDRDKATGFSDLFDAIEYANHFLNGAYTDSDGWV